MREATLHSDGAKSDKIPISFQVCPRGLSLPGGSHFWHTHPEFTYIQSVSGILLGGQHAATTRFLSPCTCFAAASFDVRPLPRRFVAVLGCTLFLAGSILSGAAVRDTEWCYGRGDSVPRVGSRANRVQRVCACGPVLHARRCVTLTD